MHYRREIDGLRAVAVLPVIAFHAGLPLFAGGFAGVDVFFVLSGYLITGILLADLARGRFSLVDFYRRRARRLLPALAVVVLACLPFAWAWMGPEAFAGFARSLVAAGLFAANVLFWQEGGYFATAAEVKPLLHTWSLAVEEQFYLLFPPVLALMWRRLRRFLFAGVALLALSSFLLAVLSVGARPEAAFYLAPTRAWELLAGALLALHARHHPAAPCEGPAALGLAMILAALLFYDAQTPFPSAWTLLPVVGTVLVLRHGQAGTRTAALLSWPPFVGVGLISYSAYLWHQPLFAFARLRSLDAPAPVVMALLALVTLALAWVTWRWVEQPFRRGWSGPVLPVAGGMLAVMIALGLVLPHLDRGLPAALAPAPVMARDDHPCALHTHVSEARIAACLEQAQARPKVVLIGDSHAMAISAALRGALGSDGGMLISFAHVGCYPIPGTTRVPGRGQGGCHRLRDQAWQTLAALGPDVPLVVVARWTLALEGTRFDNGEGGREHGTPVRLQVHPAGSDLPTHTQDWLATQAAQRPVVVLGPFPEAGWDVPARLAKMALFGKGQQLSTALAVQHRRMARAQAMLADLPVRGVTVVPLAPLFCDREIPGRCVNAVPGMTFYLDDDHPAAPAAARIADAALAALHRAGAAPRRAARGSQGRE